jgi:hypothetical protein
MKEYHVSFMVVWADTVEAESPEEAVDIVVRDCPYDGIDDIYVVDTETGEDFEF